MKKKAIAILVSITVAVVLVTTFAINQYSSTIVIRGEAKGSSAMIGNYSYFESDGTIYSLAPDRFPVCAMLEFIKQPQVYERAVGEGYADCSEIYKYWYAGKGVYTNFTRVVVGFPNETYFIYKATVLVNQSVPHDLTSVVMYCNKTNHNYLSLDPEQIGYACSFDKSVNYTIPELNI